MRYVSILLLSLIVLGPGCKTTAEQSSDMTEDSAMTQSAPMMMGTVRYIDLEGGFYGIEADDGSRYFPLNLSGSYKEDGLRVRFSVSPRSDVMTTTMWGTTCDIVEIEKR